jgi:excisionase family DNA binding protein
MDAMKQYYRTSEVARIFGISRVSVWRWCKEGKLLAVVLPSGQRRIAREDVERILATGQATEQETTT